MSERKTTSAWIAAALASSIGVALALVPLRAGSTGSAPPATPAYWIADRDAGELVLLDPSLFVVDRFALPSPVRLAVRSDGSAWVLCSSGGSDAARSALVRVAPSGVQASRLELPHCRALELGERDLAVLVLDGPGAWRSIARVDLESELTVLGLLERACCIAVAGERVVAGTEDGEVVLFASRERTAPLVRRRVADSVLDLARGPRASSWWVLLRRGERTELALLGDDLEPRWRVECELAEARLVPVPGEERVWIAGDDARVERFGSRGALELGARSLAQLGIEGGVAERDGSVLLAAPGAVLRIDALGTPALAQGGFSYVSAVARTREPP